MNEQNKPSARLGDVLTLAKFKRLLELEPNSTPDQVRLADETALKQFCALIEGSELERGLFVEITAGVLGKKAILFLNC